MTYRNHGTQFPNLSGSNCPSDARKGMLTVAELGLIRDPSIRARVGREIGRYNVDALGFTTPKKENPIVYSSERKNAI